MENVVLVIFIFRIFLDVKACVWYFTPTHTTLSLSALCSSLLLVFPSFIQSFSACLNDLVKEFVVGIIIRLEKIKKRDTNFFYLDFLGLSLLIFCYYYTFSLHCFILRVDISTSCLYIIHHTPVSVVFHFPYIKIIIYTFTKQALKVHHMVFEQLLHLLM